MNTVVVQLTSRGVGAIAVVMVAGPEAARVVAGFSRSRRAGTMRPGDILHTNLVDPASGNEPPVVLDDALVVCTQGDRYELHLHGGTAVVESVLAALQAAGVAIISAEEAGARGLFGEPQSLRAELALMLPCAQTMTAVRLLGAQVEQGMTRWAKKWLDWLEAAPGDRRMEEAGVEMWRFHSAAQWLSVRSCALARLLDPPRIAIIGPPNAGKSTLANALLGRPMSITSDIAGTTRDWVDAQAIFLAPSPNGPPIEVPVILVDTAGIRDTADPLERESIRRTHGQAKMADAIILLLDAMHPPTADELEIASRYPGCAVIVGVNKVDLLAGPHSIPDYPHAIALSAKNQRGLDALMAAVLRQLDLGAITGDEPFAFAQRQRSILHELAYTATPASAARLLRGLVDGGPPE